jgi:hypothetical protein
MTTEEKTNGEDKKEAGFGFPFGGPQGMKEMMSRWCPSGTGFCNCCSTTKLTKNEESK